MGKNLVEMKNVGVRKFFFANMIFTYFYSSHYYSYVTSETADVVSAVRFFWEQETVLYNLVMTWHCDTSIYLLFESRLFLWAWLLNQYQYLCLLSQRWLYSPIVWHVSGCYWFLLWLWLFHAYQYVCRCFMEISHLGRNITPQHNLPFSGNLEWFPIIKSITRNLF
jgi:hypothetical protein